MALSPYLKVEACAPGREYQQEHQIELLGPVDTDPPMAGACREQLRHRVGQQRAADAFAADDGSVGSALVQESMNERRGEPLLVLLRWPLSLDHQHSIQIM